jgi:hypothetical protein
VTPEVWSRTAHVAGVMPRSCYGEVEEARAWRNSIESARGRIRPTYVVAGGRIIGATVGRGPFSPDVWFTRFRHGEKPSAMRRMRDDMQRLPLMFPSHDLEGHPFRCSWSDYNALINDITTNAKFGRTYFAKTPSTAPVANNWYDLWPVTGNPTAGSITNSANTATNYSDATAGSMNKRGNVSTDQMHLLSFLAVANANTPILQLYDRVLCYDQNAYTAGSSQALTNTNTAARYNTGAPGLLPWICTGGTVQGSTAANLTVFTYADQSNNAGHTMPTTPTVTFIPSAAAATSTLGARMIVPITSGQTVTWGPYVPLANGDSGSRSITNYTTSAANTGSWSIVLSHPLADMSIPNAGIPSQTDRVFQISELERVFDGACLSLAMFTPAATAITTFMGGITFGWGA